MKEDRALIPLLVSPGITWYCLVLPGIAWYCLVLLGITWYCLVYYMVLFGIVDGGVILTPLLVPQFTQSPETGLSSPD